MADKVNISTWTYMNFHIGGMGFHGFSSFFSMGLTGFVISFDESHFIKVQEW